MAAESGDSVSVPDLINAVSMAEASPVASELFFKLQAAIKNRTNPVIMHDFNIVFILFCYFKSANIIE
jgi:hypothetical protein